MRKAPAKLPITKAEIAKLQEELRLSREEEEKVSKERDEVVVKVGEQDHELTIQDEVNVKLVDTQKDLQTEITRLNEAAAASATRVENILKKESEDIAKLHADHESVIQAHVLAAKERQLQVTRLEGEIASLNQVITSTRSPQHLRIGDIPRELLLEYMLNYMRSKAFEIACRQFYEYFLGQGFSLLRERLYQRDPSINLRDMRFFYGDA